MVFHIPRLGLAVVALSLLSTAIIRADDDPHLGGPEWRQAGAWLCAAGSVEDRLDCLGREIDVLNREREQMNRRFEDVNRKLDEMAKPKVTPLNHLDTP
jgi:hypothetical protein